MLVIYKTERIDSVKGDFFFFRKKGSCLGISTKGEGEGCSAGELSEIGDGGGADF